MEILGIIPARGGSKGISGKNLAKIGGKSLLAHTCDAARGSKRLTRLILSTDSAEIVVAGRELGVDVPFLRPSNLATDEAPMFDVLRHALTELNTKEHYDPDVVVLLQPTSPLRRAHHIDEAIDLLLATGADTVVSVIPVPHNFTPSSLMRMEQERLVSFDRNGTPQLRRQDKAELYARNGPAVLVLRSAFLKDADSFYSGDTRPYVMDRNSSIDIDDASDLAYAEFLLT